VGGPPSFQQQSSNSTGSRGQGDSEAGHRAHSGQKGIVEKGLAGPTLAIHEEEVALQHKKTLPTAEEADQVRGIILTTLPQPLSSYYGKFGMGL
jgi:hypothetical protein